MTKLNLHCGDYPKADSLNFDIRPSFSDKNQKVKLTGDYNFTESNEISSNSVDDIVVNVGLLEDNLPENIPNLVQNWKNLLKQNGTLKLYFNEIQSICQGVSSGRLTTKDFHNIIKDHKSHLSWKEIYNVCLEVGLANISTNIIDDIAIIHMIKV